LAPGDTAACLQTARLIVKPAMNDLAVARRSLKPDRGSTFEDKHTLPGQRQRPSRRKSDNPGTDHHTFNLVQLASRIVIENRRVGPATPACRQRPCGRRNTLTRTYGDRA